jgi:acetate CoA/acetoacetate CoA-transferase beta subunit
MADVKTIIAQRAARFLKDGDVVNLGIGMPEMVANFLPEDVEVFFQAENGIMGMGPVATDENEDVNVSNAGGKYVTIIPGACYFDSAFSFGLIRGGHVDATILGALQVDAEGSLASHIIPGKMVPGMGGAMDLVSGAENVIVITRSNAIHFFTVSCPPILTYCVPAQQNKDTCRHTGSIN